MKAGRGSNSTGLATLERPRHLGRASTLSAAEAVAIVATAYTASDKITNHMLVFVARNQAKKMR
jgi:hypothetical protein